ncbi:MAG TPA: TetR family transcriptional regulator [Gaiellaceae bacterium]|nr:TetR family transcriptional regulator [Gaiellaceae bacterium]
MPRDPEETKRRIFEAAQAEFAEHGIAGARIDRIAGAARANKQLIYAYFGNKRELFEQVIGANLARFVEEVPFTPTDLATYAAAQFDFYLEHPDHARISAWHALEPGESEHPVAAVRAELQRRARAVAHAQKQGLVDDSVSAVDLLALINAMASSSVVQIPERAPLRSRREVARRRQTVIEAVTRLTAGTTAGELRS